MNLIQINRMAKEFAKQYWDMDFNVPIEVNSRLTRALGRMRFKVSYQYRRKIYTPNKLELAARLMENYKDETIISVLKHELCHWALAVQGKPFEDGHPVFEREIIRVGASSTNTIEPAGTLYTVKCSKCKNIVSKNEKQSRLIKYVEGTRRSTYSSRCCGAKMEWGPILEVEDTFGTDERRERVLSASSAPAQSLPSVHPTAIVTPSTTAPKAVLTEILIPGPRGVTNKQMIPAITKALDLNRKDLVIALNTQYPDVFQGSVKYLNKTYKSKFERLMS